jgi:outer membrane protein assembly factor BamB
VRRLSAGLYLTVALTLLGVLVIAPSAMAAGPTSSLDFQVDPAHDGSLSGMSLPTPLGQVWSDQFGAPVSYPVVADGMVYVTTEISGDSQTSVLALNQSTGDVVWQHPVGDWAALTYDSGRIFAVDGGGLLTAFDATTGAIDWSSQLPGQYSFSSPPTAAGGVVYDGGAGEGGTLYANNEATGALVWSASVANGDDSSPAVAGGDVYVTYPDNYYAFDAANGDLVWLDALGGDGGGGETPVVADGHVFIRDWTTPARIVSATSGALQGPLGSTAAPAVANGTAYELNGSNLEATPDDGLGSVSWTFAGDGGLDTSPLVIGTAVWVGSQTGELYAVDATTGKELWSTDVGSGIESPGWAGQTGLGAGDGNLLVPAGDSLVDLASTGKSGLPANSTPPTISPSSAIEAGQTLSVTTGSWTNDPSSYAYEWLDCDSTGDNCTSIPNAIGDTYTLTSSDIGSTIEASVTATNGTGSGVPATSVATAVVQAPPAEVAPALQTAPTLGGSTTVGGTLTATSGTWTGSAPIAYSYQWLSCSGDGCAAIDGATQPSLTVTSADAGDQLEVVVAASNGAGTAIAVSQPSATVPGNPPSSGPSSSSSSSSSSSPSGVAPSVSTQAPATSDSSVTATTTLLRPAALAREIVTRLRIGSLLTDPKTTLRIAVPGPGRLIVDWYVNGARRHRLLVAAGQLTFTGAGTRSLLLTLTRRGLRLLRSARHTVTIVAIAEYSPAHGTPLVATTRFGLRRG